MKYTFSEYKELRKKHDEEMNCLDWTAGSDYPTLYHNICETWKKNPNGFSVTLTRPIMTLETFHNDMEFYQWIKEKFPKPENRPPFGWWPNQGWWMFFKTFEDLKKFNNKGPWKDKIIYNVKSLDLYTGGVEITYSDDEKDYLLFDEVELDKQ